VIAPCNPPVDAVPRSATRRDGVGSVDDGLMPSALTRSPRLVRWDRKKSWWRSLGGSWPRLKTRAAAIRTLWPWGAPIGDARSTSAICILGCPSIGCALILGRGGVMGDIPQPLPSTVDLGRLAFPMPNPPPALAPDAKPGSGFRRYVRQTPHTESFHG
jgi:hypothetical protein